MKLVVYMLAVIPAFAQFQSVVPSKTTDPFAAPGDPHFVLYADLPNPLPGVVAGYLNVNQAGRLASIGHRYFYEESAHLYFGYDIVIQPEVEVDVYRVTLSPLSIGPLDFQTAAEDSLDPSRWTNLAPTLPSSRVLRAGDPLMINVFGPADGRKLVDTMTVVPMPAAPPRGYSGTGREMWQWSHSTMRSGYSAPARQSSDVFGKPRSFAAADAEMRLQLGSVSVNGTKDRSDGTRNASGSLVWFYSPGHGRYILSLAPRPDLGFVQAGEVRGGRVSFTVDKDEVLLESPTMIAPGDSAYLLYVLHDAGWQPTARGQMGQILCGSVSPRELAAVAR